MENKNKLTTGDKIRKFRQEQGLTQKQLAELTGMYESQIRKYETGKVFPKIQTLQKIATVFKIPVGELYADSTIELDRLTSQALEWIKSETDKTINNQLSETELLINYRKLNDQGKDEALKRVAELTEIKKYTSHRIVAVYKSSGSTDQ